MKHYRIISSVWMLSASAITAIIGYDIVRSLKLDVEYGGAVTSDGIGIAFCSLMIIGAIGLFAAKTWARAAVGALAVLLGLYCLSFLAMVGLEYGTFWYIAAWIGVAFEVYTFGVVCAVKPRRQQ